MDVGIVPIFNGISSFAWHRLEIYAALGSWAAENESALPVQDADVMSLVEATRSTRGQRDDLRLRLKMLEAQTGAPGRKG